MTFAPVSAVAGGAQGPTPNTLIDTWIAVWTHFRDGARHRRLYTADDEIHRGGDRGRRLHRRRLTGAPMVGLRQALPEARKDRAYGHSH